MTRIEILGLGVRGVHGLPAERDHAQPFVVDIELWFDGAAAAESDDLERTIDYREVNRAVRSVVEEESYTLLEAIADAIARRVLDLGATKVGVRVSKPRAALGMDAREVAVRVERSSG